MTSLKVDLRVKFGLVEFYQTGKLIMMIQINQLTKQTCVTHCDDNSPNIVAYFS